MLINAISTRVPLDHLGVTHGSSLLLVVQTADGAILSVFVYQEQPEVTSREKKPVNN